MLTEQKEKLSRQNILEEYKTQLQELKEQVKKNNLDKNHFDTLAKGLGKDFNFKNEISEKDIDELIDYLETLEKSEINEATLESMKNALNEIKKTKNSLNSLKKEVSEKDKEIKVVEEKIQNYKKRFQTLSKKHPFWTKAMISILPDKLKGLFLPKDQLTNIESSNNIFQIINKIKQILLNAFTPILVILFPFFAPKELKKFAEDIKNDLGNVDLSILSKFTGKLGETFELSQEKKEELLNKINERLKVAIKNTVKKISGKDISEEKLKIIMDKINVKGLYEDSEILKVWKALEGKDIEGANWGKAGIEGITLPFKLASKIIYVLYQEGYISVWDIAVYFSKKSGEIVINSFSLLGSGVELIKGTISPENFEDEVRRLLDASPDAGKFILAVMMYRHGGVLFSTLGKISEYASKLVIYSISGESRAYKNIISGLRGNVDEYLRVLKKINDLAPNDIKFQKLSLLDKTLNDLEKANELVKILNENPKITGKDLLSNKHYSELVEFLGTDINKLKPQELRSVLSARIESIGRDLNLYIGEFPAYVSKTFKGIVGEKYLLNNLAKRIETTTKFLANVVRDDTLFGKFKSLYSKVGLTGEMLQIDPTYDKVVFKFRDVKTFKDFTNNLLILAKQSPEILRFMFDKFPIFVVAGLSIDSVQEGNIGEIIKNLAFLVPIIGSGFMLVDSLYVGKENTTQAYVASVLLVGEFGYIGYKGFKGDLKGIRNFFLKPGKDLIEIVGAMSKTAFTAGKLTGDFAKVIVNGKPVNSLDEIKRLLLNKKTLALLKSKKLAPFLLVFGIATYLYTDNDFIEEFKKSCKGDLNECLKAKWGELKNEEKAQVIEVAFANHLLSAEGISCEFKDGRYEVIFDENYKVLPNYANMTYLAKKIESLLEQYGDANVKISRGVKKSLVDKYFKELKLNDKKAQKEMLISMGYPEELIKKLL